MLMLNSTHYRNFLLQKSFLLQTIGHWLQLRTHRLDMFASILAT